MRTWMGVGVLLSCCCLLLSVQAWADRIAFTGSVGGRYQVFVIEDDGTDLLQISNDLYNDYNPQWSPDGTQLAFFSDQLSGSTGPGERDIYLVNADGTGLRTLLATDAYTFHWGPSGTLIYQTDDPPTRLFKILEPGVSSPVLIDDTHIWQGGQISPDGALIISNGNSVVYVINSDGTGFKTLANPESVGGPAGWHPDSVLFVNHGHRYVEMVNSLNNDRTTIGDFSGSGKPGNSVWSADGKYIAFINPTGSSVSQIAYVYDVDSSALNSFDNEIVRTGNFSADSTMIAVATYVGGEYQVGSFNHISGTVTSFYGPVEVNPVLFEAPQYAPSSIPEVGDANLDGSYTLLDARLAYSHSQDCITLTGEAFAQADVDGSGTVAIDDAIAIAEYVIGVRSSLP